MSKNEQRLLRFKKSLLPSVYCIFCTMIPSNNSMFVGGDTVERMTATLLSALLISRSFYVILELFLHLFVRFKLGLVQSLKLSLIT
jgi:hypothetical protein